MGIVIYNYGGGDIYKEAKEDYERNIRICLYN